MNYCRVSKQKTRLIVPSVGPRLGRTFDFGRALKSVSTLVSRPKKPAETRTARPEGRRPGRGRRRGPSLGTGVLGGMLFRALNRLKNNGFQRTEGYRVAFAPSRRESVKNAGVDRRHPGLHDLGEHRPCALHIAITWAFLLVRSEGLSGRFSWPAALCSLPAFFGGSCPFTAFFGLAFVAG
jgi:hypothetical protein